DILEADVEVAVQSYFRRGQPVHVVANLPYYITTPILMKLLSDQLSITSYTVMIQKEVADRMSAQPNNKSYGSLTIAVQYYTKADIVMTVPKTVFMPQPNVDSAILRLVKREEPLVHVEDENYFFALVRACFAQRRKTIKNNLANHFKGKYDKSFIANVLEKMEIDEKRRGESLSIEEFAQLANAFYKQDIIQ